MLPEDVRRIAAMDDPVLRNLEITQCYAELAAAVTARLGTGANWCTYATWASRQAGRTIRGEDLLDGLGLRLGERRWLLRPFVSLWRSLLRRGLFRPETRLGRLTGEVHTPLDAFGRASDAVARGNLKVFEEIGLAFARWLAREPLGLAPGDPPDGQRLLASAFERYERASAAPQVVLANLEIGLHEQTRLQEQIREALAAGVATGEDLGRRALVALFPSARRWWAFVRGPAEAVAGGLARALQRTSERLAREIVTDSVMTLSLPGRVLALGRNLDDAIPPELAADPELRALLARWEPEPPAADDCGARDWGELDERMHYIAHLFRVFHARPELAGEPFTPEQVAAFRAGRIPEGDL